MKSAMTRSSLWKEIETSLTSDIAQGLYGPGDKLPTESQLAARFGVNRHTVRRALANMAEAGLVLSRRGAGVFVTQTPTDYPIGRRVRFHQNLEASGRVPGKSFLSITTRRASDAEAQALELAPGAMVHVCEGLATSDEQPIALFRSVFCAQRFPDLPQALEQTKSITAALEQCGVRDFTRKSTRLSARKASVRHALHLRLPEGAALLRSEAVNVDEAGHPVEYGRTWFAGDRVVLTIDL